MIIQEMTREQFKELPVLDDWETYDCDSIVLLPTEIQYEDLEYNCYYVIVCNKNEAIGKMTIYDIAQLLLENNFNRVGIDCLHKSGLMRLFFKSNKYVARPIFHEIIKKKGEE